MLRRFVATSSLLALTLGSACGPRPGAHSAAPLDRECGGCITAHEHEGILELRNCSPVNSQVVLLKPAGDTDANQGCTATGSVTIEKQGWAAIAFYAAVAEAPPVSILDKSDSNCNATGSTGIVNCVIPPPPPQACSSQPIGGRDHIGFILILPKKG